MSEQLPKIVVNRLVGNEMRPGTDSHPDANLLTAFVERVLPEREKGGILRHLAECASCREIVALAQPSGVETGAVFVAPRALWSRGSIWRWASLAACTVVAVSLVLHKRENRSLAVADQAHAPANPAALSAGKPSPSVATEPAVAQDLNAERTIAGSLPSERRVAPLSVEPSAPKNGVEGTLSYSLSRSDAAAPARELSKPIFGGSMQQPPAPVVAPSAGASSAAPSAVQSNAASAAASVRARSEMAARAQTTTDAVEVSGEAVAGIAADGKEDQPRLAKAKVFEKSAAQQTVDAAVAAAPGAASATPYAPTDKDEFRASSAQLASTGAFAAARQAANWQVTDAGNLQRSFDGGKSWESVSVNQAVRLRVVAAVGFHIWAGGDGGALFRSEDGGSHFAVVKVSQNGASLTGNIVVLTFADAQHGRLETSAHQVWTTADGGNAWQPFAPAK